MFKRVDIKTGYLCNNNCKFCVQAHNKKYANKSYEEIVKSLEKSAKENYQGVVFTGGEFTLRKDCIKLVSIAKKLGYTSIQIQSNGRMFSNLEFCKKIIKAGANEFAPALHGHKKEIHDYLTSAPESFTQTLQGIINLKQLNQKILVNHVIVKPNYRYAPYFAKLMVKLKVNQFQYAFVHAMGNAMKNFENIVPYKSLAIPYLKKGIDITKNTKTKVMVEAVPFCLMQDYEKYVSELYIPQTRIEEKDRTIENFTKAKLEHSKIKFEKCQKCKYYFICEGPWREYPEKFGEEEFIPIKGKKITDARILMK